MSDVDNAMAVGAMEGIVDENSTHRLMLGFLASESTARSEAPPNKRHVESVEALSHLMKRTREYAMTVIHYELFEKQEGFAEPLCGILQSLEPGVCRGIQLNGVPAVEDVRKVKLMHPQLEMIYQIRPDLLQNGPDAVVNEIGTYRNAFDHVLIYPSCGRGIDIDIQGALSIYRKLRAAFRHLSIGFAGGHSDKNIFDRIRLISSQTGTNNFSVDAEGKLRHPQTDELDGTAARNYLRQSARAFYMPRRTLK